MIAAAANPKTTCREPENQKFFPVNNVIATPIINNPKALITTLMMIAFVPFMKRNGNNGMIAPTEKKMKEYIAASIAEPFNSSAGA